MEFFEVRADIAFPRLQRLTTNKVQLGIIRIGNLFETAGIFVAHFEEVSLVGHILELNYRTAGMFYDLLLVRQE